MKPFQRTTIYILLYSYVIAIIFFSQVRPVRDSMIDAVQLWKKLTGEDANGNDCLFTKCTILLRVLLFHT
jgi:hypothetical protein